MSSSRTSRARHGRKRRLGNSQPSAGLRFTRISCAVIWCLLAGAPIFGFSAFKQVLVANGVYREFCTPQEVEWWSEKGSHGPLLCTEQDYRLNSMFAYALAISGLLVLPVSAILDVYGPRVCGILASILLTFASLSLRAGTSITVGPYLDGYILGYILLGCASPPLFMSSLQLSTSFPKYGGSILVLLTAAMDGSSAVFLAFKLADRNGYIGSISQFFTWYLFVPAFVFISQFVIMPSRGFKTVAELQRIIEVSSPFTLAGKSRGDEENNADDDGYSYKWYRQQNNGHNGSRGDSTGAGNSYSFPEIASSQNEDSTPGEIDFTGAYRDNIDGNRATSGINVSSTVPRSESLSPNTSTINDGDDAEGENSPLLQHGDSSETFDDNDEYNNILADEEEAVANLNLVKDVTEVSGVWGALHNARVSQQLTSMWFILIILFSAVTTLHINYFIASIWKSYNYRLDGDTTSGSREVKLILDYFDFALPIGSILSVPFIGFILDNMSTLRAFTIIYVLAISIGFLQLVSGSVVAGCLGITLFVPYRSLLFTAIPDYTVNIFGFHTFGLVYGLILAVSGLANLLILQFNSGPLKMHHRLADPNSTNELLLGLTALVGLVLIMYIWLQGKKIRRKQLEDEAESAPIQQMPEARITTNHDCRSGTCDDCVCEANVN
ncbi:hypothetical protein AWJ20_4635 [Sugiyamaella lignohabitans]|uniref:Protein FMP42 n=1 Tax=Sugiyamaella lignohabitans TaxID=796027 RepID=A0A167E676_9ASCO|nr:uncharacterized protein AWJ20_4635 [Sugiyamaella lignohabitans]ANB13692.1 hypothetical protein AWJ20_4635 [Sugiyamaella lignohabitans]